MLRPSKWFGWSRSPEAPRSNPHSLEQLKILYNFLEKNQTVSEHNRTVLVETLRQIAEILIWGDQNDSTVFDFFLEKNMLCFFLRIMKQKCGGFVCTQLLQTLNILFENIKNETSLYYLLSNNHVNSIIVHKFDFDDEEVMAYYISFLKTLSLKLNNHTVHFFFNEHTADFPLYTEAIKFFNHSEKMVRIAVRTLTLNVFRVRENAMLRFIRDCTAAPYFSNLSWFIGKHVLDIESSLSSYIAFQQSNLSNSSNSGHNLIIRLEDLVAEHLDHLHYLNDILRLNIDDLNSVLSDNLLHRLIIPLYIHSFLSIVSSHYLSLPHKELTTTTTTSLAKADQSETRFIQSAQNSSLSTSVALFLLTQAYIIFSYGPLLNTLVEFLLKSRKADIELNAERCEFTQPNKSLEQAIEQAISSSSNFGNSENCSESGSFQSLTSKVPVLDENLNDTSSRTKKCPENFGQPNNIILPQKNLPFSNVGSTTSLDESTIELNVQQQTNCDFNYSDPKLSESSTAVGVQSENEPDCNLVDWANRPFLVALLATLNANISSVTVGSEATSLEGSCANALNHLPNRPPSADISNSSNNQANNNNNCDPCSIDSQKSLLTKSCHSSKVTDSIPEICSPDDRIVLFTLSLISSILSNKEIDAKHYKGIFIPNAGESPLIESESFCSELINSLLLIVRQCCTQNYSITLVTFELAVYLFKKIVFYYRCLERSESSELSEKPKLRSKLFLSDHQLALLEQANEDASHLLRQYFRATEESVFLEIFEQEAEIAANAAAVSSADEISSNSARSNRSSLSSSSPLKIWSYNLNLNLEKLFMDSALLLPPKEISPGLSDSNFYLRLPGTDYEKTRYAVKIFFILRRLSFDVRSADSSNVILEKPFDFSNLFANSASSSNICLDQFLDLENSDLIACSVKFYYPLNQNRSTFGSSSIRTRNNANYSNSSSRSESPAPSTSRKKLFMVITSDLVILIEPDNKRYGCGIIRFLARLQDLEILPNSYAVTQLTSPPIPEKEKDSGTLFVFFRRHQLSTSMSNSSSSSFSRPPPLSSSNSIILGFAFDDRIRYFAAMRHLSKAQSKVRDRKLSGVIRLIDLNTASDNSSSVAGQPSFQHYAANRLKLSDYADGPMKKKTISSNHHLALGRKFAVPGGAVLSMNSANSAAESGPLMSGINKFDLAVKKRYPIATTTTTTTGPSSAGRNRHSNNNSTLNAASSSKGATGATEIRIKRTKKLKYPIENVIQSNTLTTGAAVDQDAIPLKDLSPQTIRRPNNNNNNESGEATENAQPERFNDDSEQAGLGNFSSNRLHPHNNNNNNSRIQDYLDDHKSAS